MCYTGRLLYPIVLIVECVYITWYEDDHYQVTMVELMMSSVMTAGIGDIMVKEVAMVTATLS